jgi:integrase
MLASSLPGSMGRHKSRHETVTNLSELTERCRHGINSRVPKFTNAVLRAVAPIDPALVPPEKLRNQVLIGRAALPCTYLVVEPSGHVSGAVQHRAIGTRKAIADFRIHTIEQFERRAREILVAAKAGRNLFAEEKEIASQKKAEQSLGAIIDRYLAEPAIRKLRSYRLKEHYLKQVWAPLHDYSAEQIERSAILPELRQIASTRGEVTANQAKSELATLFGYAIENGFVKRDNSPVHHLPTWKTTPRTRVLTLEELGSVWQHAPQVARTRDFGRVVRLLMLTGCRLKEIADLSPDEVDKSRKQLVIPGCRVKNGHDLIVPLTPAALAILDGPYYSATRVFAHIHWSRSKGLLDDMVKFKDAWVLHDLRRSFSTGCREYLPNPKPDAHLIELAINHVSGTRAGVAGHYDRSERLDDRRKLFQRWANVVLRAAEPVEDKVVPLNAS